jgi:hypothetical protein
MAYIGHQFHRIQGNNTKKVQHAACRLHSRIERLHQATITLHEQVTWDCDDSERREAIETATARSHHALATNIGCKPLHTCGYTGSDWKATLTWTCCSEVREQALRAAVNASRNDIESVLDEFYSFWNYLQLADKDAQVQFAYRAFTLLSL